MTEENKTKKSARPKPGERKLEILKALVDLLQTSKQKHITTKILAARLGLSEAALYRHFASKAQMYTALITYAESAVFTTVNQIKKSEPSGVQQVRMISLTMLDLIRSNPGIVILLCGDFLTAEDARLQESINLLFNKIHTQIKQSLLMGVAEKELPEDYDVTSRADLLGCYIRGLWFNFSKGMYKPGKDAQVHQKAIDYALGIV